MITSVDNYEFREPVIPPNSSYKYFSSTLAVFAIIGSFLLAFLSVEVRSVEHSFKSAELSEHLPLLLTADSPDEIEVKFQSLTNAPDGVLLSTSRVAGSNSITLIKSSEYISFGYASSSVGQLQADSSINLELKSLSSCELGLIYKEKELSLWCGQAEVANLPYVFDSIGPVLTHLYSPFGDVTVTTKPAISVTTEIRDYIKYSLLIFLIGVLSTFFFLHLRTSRFNPPSKLPQHSRLKKFTPRILDLIVFLYLSLAAFVAWPLDDDGNVLATVSSIADVGGLSNYYSVSAAFQPTGNFPYLFISEYLNSVDSMFLIRAPFVCAAFITWVLVRKTLEVLIPKSKAQFISQISAAFFFTAGAFGFVSVRPEAFVALALGLALYLSSKILTQGNVHRFYIIHIGGLAGLALLIHQTGFILVGLFFGLLITSFSMIEVFKILKSQTIYLAIWLSSLSVIAFWNADLKTLIQWASDFSSQGSHSRPVFEEFFRYSNGLMQLDIRSVPILWIILFIIFTPLLLFLIKSRRKVIYGKFLFVATLGVSSLALTPSKWIWHFGAITPIMGVLGGLLIYFLLKGPAKYSAPISILFLVPTVSLGLVASEKGSLGSLPLVPNPDHSLIYGKRYETLSGNIDIASTGGLLVFALLVLLVMAFMAWSLLANKSAMKLIALIVTPAFLLSTSAPLMLFSSLVSPGFSPSRMNLDHISDPLSCGALNYIPIVLPSRALPFPEFTVSPEVPLSIEESRTSVLRIFDINAQSQQVMIFNSSETDQTATVSFKTNKKARIGWDEIMFIKASEKDSTSLFINESGEPPRQTSSEIWIPLDLSNGPISISGNVTKGGSISFSTTNVLESSKTLADTYFSRKNIKTAILDPQLALFTPCLRAPAITDGVFEKTSFAVSNLSYADLGQVARLDVGNKYLREFEIFEVGCPNYNDGSGVSWINGSLCLYHLGD